MSDKDRIRLAEKRFWSKVDKSSECWNWLAAKVNGGYGQFWYQGKMLRSTHFALMCEGIDVPSGAFVCHHCDNPSCVNPDHLFIGTALDNNRDRESKGRGYKHSSTFYRGIQRVMAKKRRRFSCHEIRNIRASERSGIELAQLYAVSPQTISDIRTRKNYVDVN